MNKNILKVTIGAFAALFSLSVNAQSVGVGTNTPSPNAALEISQGGSPQGLLIPKMSGVQMGVLETSLNNPQDLGMVIYNLDSTAFLFWDGSGFKEFGGTFSLPSGGTVSDYLVGDNTWMDFNTSARAALSGTAPVNYNSTSGVLSLDNSGVTAGTYGSGTEIPVVQVDTFGRVVTIGTVALPASLPSGGTSSDYLLGDNSWGDFNASARGALSGTSPVSFNSSNGEISLETTGFAAGSYGSTTEVPVVELDAYGRVVSVNLATIPAALPTGGTSADYLIGNNTWGDFNSSARSAVSAIAPLSYNTVTGVMSLSTSGVTAGTYGSSAQIAQVSVDAYGRVTGISNVTAPTSPWTASGADAYFTGGTVGIGTSTPGYTFEVVGTSGLGNTDVSGALDVTGGLTSVEDFDVVGDVVIDNGTITLSDAVFSTGSNGIIQASGTGVLSKLDYSGTVAEVLRGDGSWGTIPSSADNLGDHAATQNISLNNFALSNDGVADGDGLVVDNNGNMAIGGVVNSAYKLYVYGKLKSDGITEMSDRRLKQDIETLSSSLYKIQQLRGVNYNWRKENNIGVEFEEGIQVGLIAQEVETVFPELVDTDDQGYKSVEYSKLVAVLIEALKEQELKISSLELQTKGLEDVKAEVEKLKAEISKYSMR